MKAKDPKVEDLEASPKTELEDQDVNANLKEHAKDLKFRPFRCLKARTRKLQREKVER